MPKPTPAPKLTADDALRDAEAALEFQRDRAYELYQALERALVDIRRLIGGAPGEHIRREGPLRYASLGESADIIDAIVLYLDHAGPRTALEIVEEIVGGGFFARRSLGRRRDPTRPGGPGSAETQVMKSIEFHLRTIEEKQRLYWKRGKNVKIQPPKLRKMTLAGGEGADTRELIGRYGWPDEKFV